MQVEGNEPREESQSEQVQSEPVPAEQASVEQAPAEQASVEQAPAEQASVEQASVEQAPVEEVPSEPLQGEQVPGDETQGEPAQIDRSGTPIEVGAIIQGTVQRITPYGAFLQLEGGKIGLVHISEIDRNYVKDVREHLREADVVEAKVISIKDDGKIDLSIKALQDPQPRIDRRRGRDPEFEQKLKRFLRQSEERQVDFKRSVEHKRR